ncbi:MAG: preprotein translocase subunit SecA [Christensenellales bacterium]|jgi:preprotein translocase subunit SecA
MGFFKKIFGRGSPVKKFMPVVDRINALEPETKALADAQLRAKTEEFKRRVAAGESLDDLLPEAFAVVREAAWRAIGMRHFDVQLIGGIVLHQGRIAEMKTGEGKTLVATLPCYLNALAGRGVHVVTVNDYLAKRDAEWMGKVHRFLGLSVGVILSQMPSDERRKSYSCDITYGTNSEFGFDYLRDNMCVYKEDMVQRDLHYAIVDEVDSILIDEARTPLIISGRGDDSGDMYLKADKFVKYLKRGEDVVETSKYEAMTLTAEQAFDNSGDYTVDPKRRTVSLTASGVEKAERYFMVDRLTDADNTELNHYIQQALKANALFKKDVDYVVQDGKVLIVDEFTGRIMYGRRYSEGLHQAIEAKEGVAIKNESKTLATITYQNYFRMYRKLAGMTGTAKTEEAEFNGIYNLDVVEIPTNKPNIRIDYDDLVFLSEDAKFKAIINEIVQVHATRRPVLVGTVSVEKSERVSAMLERRGIRHEVLNAKNHQKEAEIVAQAGKIGAVTIATNMAGRGTDILLGGNPDFLARRALRQKGYDDALIEEATGHGDTTDEMVLTARREYAEAFAEFKKMTDQEHEEVVALGGLHIIGTERHDARRIDNQLRGRAGRQGDPGSTRFYLSLDDDLLRYFGGENLKAIASRIAGKNGADEPMEMGLLTRQIESAQKRIELMHYNARKNVLQFDDVMNKQREVIYSQRRRVLLGEDVADSIQSLIVELVDHAVNTYCPEASDPEEWDLAAMATHLSRFFFQPGENPWAGLTKEQRSSLSREQLAAELLDRAREEYGKREQELASFGISMRDAEREVLLRVVDTHWIEHIDAMDRLRDGIYLQAYGNRDPAKEYAIAGYDMFEEMVASINETMLAALFHVSVRGVPKERKAKTGIARQAAAAPNRPATTAGAQKSPMQEQSTNRQNQETQQPVRVEKKAGRNDPCPCGSGKKYKNCCGKNAD